jgi:putative protease
MLQKTPELLAPVGDMDRLHVALNFGADAVYLAGKNFGLRSNAVNFTNCELSEAVRICHERGKKIYITLNIFARNNDFDAIIEYIKFLESIKVDAVIVSDLGVLKIVKTHTNIPIHVSTQANILNKYTAQQYVELGASRVILARECSLKEITEIAKHVAGKCEIEVFVHGAMCVSYSGRCLMSNYLSNRESNRGECNQPCRWKYYLVEEKRPDDKFEIIQDDRGSYIMNSRDLCLINHLRELQMAGVHSYKIEGRMKTEYYLAGTVNAYRRAMNWEVYNYDEELAKIAHRNYTTGFMFPSAKEQTLHIESAAQKQTHEFTGIVLHSHPLHTNECAPLYKIELEMRNAFRVGDTLEILSPNNTFNKTFKVEEIVDRDGVYIDRANKCKEIYIMTCPHKLLCGDLLRRKKFSDIV